MKDNGGGSDVPAKKKKSSVPPHRRYMGISMLAITEQIIDELRVKLHIPAQITHGVVVFKILDGSPADRAGVEPGNPTIIKLLRVKYKSHILLIWVVAST